MGEILAGALPWAAPCIWESAPRCDRSGVARGPVATGPLARRVAPAAPQATTVGEHWDRRRCHVRPNSRLASNRTRKAGYRGEDHLWSGRFVRHVGCPHWSGWTILAGREDGGGHRTAR